MYQFIKLAKVKAKLNKMKQKLSKLLYYFFVFFLCVWLLWQFEVRVSDVFKITIRLAQKVDRDTEQAMQLGDPTITPLRQTFRQKIVFA